MKVYVDLNCNICGTETMVHETGLNEYDVYPCKKCYPGEYIEEENEDL